MILGFLFNFTEPTWIVGYIYLVESSDINVIKIWELWFFYKNKEHP